MGGHQADLIWFRRYSHVTKTLQTAKMSSPRWYPGANRGRSHAHAPAATGGEACRPAPLGARPRDDSCPLPLALPTN